MFNKQKLRESAHLLYAQHLMSLDAQRQNVTGLKGRALRTPCPIQDLSPFSITMHPIVIC